jgi:hypothetical protein
MFGDYDRFHVGESKEKDPGQMLAAASHPNSLNWNECRDLDAGGPRKYILRPVKIHHKDTQWLWIDATIPLRAIYFPVCQKTDEAYPQLCTYMVIDFKARNSIKLAHIDEGGWIDCPITKANGLGWSDTLTWGFNVPSIITYLSIPRKLRNPEQGLFKSKKAGDELVVCARSNRAWKPPGGTLDAQGFYREMDLAKIMSATFGVEVGWRPYKYSSFIVEVVKHVVNLGLGFVPGVGPLLCIAFGIGVQLLEDPDSFSEENVLGIGEAVLNVLISQAGKSKKYLAKNVFPKSKAGKSMKYMAKIKLPESTGATVPITAPQSVSMEGEDESQESQNYDDEEEEIVGENDSQESLNDEDEEEEIVEEIPFEVSSMEEIMLQRGFANDHEASGNDGDEDDTGDSVAKPSQQTENW